MNKTIKILGIILVILFLSVYFSRYNNNFYVSQNVLTEEAIIKFEKDLKSGKNISVKSYLKKEKDYENKLSNLGKKISYYIEVGFKKGLKFLFKCMEGLIE